MTDRDEKVATFMRCLSSYIRAEISESANESASGGGTYFEAQALEDAVQDVLQGKAIDALQRSVAVIIEEHPRILKRLNAEIDL